MTRGRWFGRLRTVWRKLFQRQPADGHGSTVQRLREELAQRAAELAELQRQSREDPVTGLLLRHHFVAQLQLQLSDVRHRGRALLLLRVPQLDALNTRLGREATDHVLSAMGHLLLTYVDRVRGAQAGRLNGSDFALFLPVSGVAAETARSLHEALLALSALRNAAVEIHFGGVDGLPLLSASAALAEADAALARAEAGESDGLVVDAHADLAVAADGAAAWRAQIAVALVGQRLRLDEQVVRDPHGHTLHLACAPQLPLGPDDTFRPTRLCVALARRSRLLPQLERATVHAALQASVQDGQHRCVTLSATSLEHLGFLDEVTAMLKAKPESTARLAIVLPWHLRTIAAVESLRATGVQLGLSLSDGDASHLATLAQAGVRFVTIDSQVLRHVSERADVAAYVVRLFRLIRSLGLSVLAEGGLAQADCEVAWELGLGGLQFSPIATDAGVASSQPALSAD